MKKVFAEIGFGNKTFLSTEIEEGNKEYRISKFIKPNIVNDYYFRVWLGKKNFIISTKDGIKIKNKKQNKIKIIFGIGGES